MENKEHNNMITQENQASKKTWRGFNLTILKVKQINYERIEVYIIATSTTKITTMTM